ncbi:MAG: DNA-binding response regulator [Chloroflexi bacterium]|nr:DNA-binding response regulator [Chloroflexota bacterium]
MRKLCSLASPIINLLLLNLLFSPLKNKATDTTTEEGTLHFCRIYHPHLLLLALNILSQPATAFVTTLRQECPAIKLLILLSDTHETNIHTLLGSGANGFILKSESPDRLVEAIHSVI